MAGDSFSRIEISSIEGRAQSTRLRQKLFHSLHTALRSSEKLIKDAILVDSGLSDSEVNLEYALAISELRTHYTSIDLEKDLKAQRAAENLGATTSVGTVYVIPAKQNLFYSVISALTAALAAGNCVVVELPPTLTKVSGVLRKILPSALDADIFAVSSTRPSEDFLAKCHVLAQSGDEEVSATGGLQSNSSPKVVAVVDRTAKIPEAAMAIGASRVSFNGRSVYAPDVILVNEFVADDFLYHLVQAVTSPLLSETPPRSPHLAKGQPDGYARTLKECEGNESVRVVVSSSNGSIVEVKDRSKAPLGRRIDGRLIIVTRITSLDDAIDLCNSFGTALEANFVFAAPIEANYTARFIDARLSCINHIPAELLVGPFAPKHPTIAPSPSPRYTPTLFRSPRPRLAHPSELTIISQDAIRSRSTKELESWSRAVLQRALPAINQGEGRAVGFFDQAFMTIGIVIVSVVAGSAFAVFRMIRQR
ncbi:uncharacterized protein A1O5_02556 [Cladophialophora psammophila CBS 110553]|uniref:Aldehyde dehydrogenase domain-containing protein n=1 Tax=Cladophialophora psammophila CBS 110553 TaxID=1182543 RepID=W9XA87_9EURO|nr:uncharacterized protein A1O5_02556 [Cladophialophora psammophila CBS 110553]EXJ74260.1 hypothetical protein A1O5_02556 [Cladophialophora psammophila CBS 110553]